LRPASFGTRSRAGNVILCVLDLVDSRGTLLAHFLPRIQILIEVSISGAAVDSEIITSWRQSKTQVDGNLGDLINGTDNA
jgi:hypothetical protein